MGGGGVEKRARTLNTHTKTPRSQVVIETNTRNNKKKITSVTGLDLFGVKLSEASKAFGKKFACGCSVTKSATGAEQVDMQVGSVTVCMCVYVFARARAGYVGLGGWGGRDVGAGLQRQPLCPQLPAINTVSPLFISCSSCSLLNTACHVAATPELPCTLCPASLTPRLPDALQGDFLDPLAELILKNFKTIKKEDIYYIGEW